MLRVVRNGLSSIYENGCLWGIVYNDGLNHIELADEALYKTFDAARASAEKLYATGQWVGDKLAVVRFVAQSDNICVIGKQSILFQCDIQVTKPFSPSSNIWAVFVIENKKTIMYGHLVEGHSPEAAIKMAEEGVKSGKITSTAYVVSITLNDLDASVSPRTDAETKRYSSKSIKSVKDITNS